MFHLFHSMQRSMSSSLFSNNTKTVIDYILEVSKKYTINSPGTWAWPSPYHHFKVGIGEFSRNKAIVTYDYHVEVEDDATGKLAFFDRGERVGVLKSYKPIEKQEDKEKIANELANMINKINADAGPPFVPHHKRAKN